MYEKNAVVQLAQGLHVRPASEFVQRARAFASKISLVKGDKAVDAKSILGLMGQGYGSHDSRRGNGRSRNGGCLVHVPVAGGVR
ncbi:HPr family phosphocarrier protein [Alicyclobacillus shizuokensis]|uniref:HPr family phosphocarrier protein n=1 Tax=Alicyclobacillus shizuokensis TaxID=392014 RepID=UPI000AD4BFBA